MIVIKSLTPINIGTLRQTCEAAKLYRREMLGAYTDVELARICNGIGADWMPQELNDFLSALTPELLPVALIHDVECYEAQRCNPSEADFAASNERFRCNGCRVAEHHYAWWHYRRYVVKSRAKACAEILRRFGRYSYFGGQTEGVEK